MGDSGHRQHFPVIRVAARTRLMTKDIVLRGANKRSVDGVGGGSASAHQSRRGANENIRRTGEVFRVSL